jgi:hypothetical protein
VRHLAVPKAIGCGLRIRARFREGVRYVNKVAELEVAVGVAAPESGSAADVPQLQSVAASSSGVGLVFAALTRSARLTTGDSILEAETPRAGEAEAPAAGGGRFIVPRIDFARSVLRERPLVLDGSAFATSLSVAGTVLQGEPQPQEVESPQEEPEEEAVEESADEG